MQIECRRKIKNPFTIAHMLEKKFTKNFLAPKKKRIKKKLRISGEKLNEAVSWSDINSGPKTEIGGRPISGDGIFVIPESSRQALSELSMRFYKKERDAAIRKIQSTAAGATFYLGAALLGRR